MQEANHTHVIFVTRSPRFSPNSVERDDAIARAVASCLTASGCSVMMVGEDRLRETEPAFGGTHLVLSMARDVEVLSDLAALERGGLPVLNSPQALLRNTRSRLTLLLSETHVPQPATVVCPATCDEVLSTLQLPLWLKRGDACAQGARDVCFIETEEELRQAFADFSARGITDSVACEHLQGDLVKFYGVAGTDFFSCAYPMSTGNFSKFGLELHNGAPKNFPFSTQELKDVADRAARVSCMPVYGGDAVVRPDGTFSIIDFNDWPSFSACRAEAARAIAQLAMSVSASQKPVWATAMAHTY